MSLDRLNLPEEASVVQHIAPPKARGAVILTVAVRDGGTHLARLRQSGCLKYILPQVFRPDAEAILVNTAGGVTGGDRIKIAASLGNGTHLSLTTQAAERIYRTLDGTSGRITARIDVGAGARLNWLPQETILFDCARLSRDLEINLRGDARMLLCETLVFGRAAMGERVHKLHLQDRICVSRDGAPLYCDGIRLNGDVHRLLARPAMAAGAGAVATLAFAAPETGALLA